MLGIVLQSVALLWCWWLLQLMLADYAAAAPHTVSSKCSCRGVEGSVLGRLVREGLVRCSSALGLLEMSSTV